VAESTQAAGGVSTREKGQQPFLVARAGAGVFAFGFCAAAGWWLVARHTPWWLYALLNTGWIMITSFTAEFIKGWRKARHRR
jgi:hypothetical protein